MYAPFKNISDHVTWLPATVICTCCPHLQKKRTEYQQVSRRKKGACSHLKLSGQAESVQSGVSDVFMRLGLHRAQVLGELGKPTESSSSCNARSDKEKQGPFMCWTMWQKVFPPNRLSVKTDSQLRKFHRIVFQWRHDEITSIFTSIVLQTPFLERTSDSSRRVKGIWPTRNGFTITDICKGKEYFVEKCYFFTSEDVQDFLLSFLELPTPSPAGPSSILPPRSRDMTETN